MLIDESKIQGNKDRHFKGQLVNEKVECFYRNHWIVLLAPTLLNMLIIAGLLTFLFAMRYYEFIEHGTLIYRGLIFMAFLFATYSMHRFFVRLYNYFLDIVIITNYRVVDLNKSIILHDTREVIDIAKVQDVTKTQDGLICNLLKYGGLIITLSSSASIKYLNYVPNPDFHFRVINRKKREYIQHKQFERRKTSGLEPTFPVRDASLYNSNEGVTAE